MKHMNNTVNLIGNLGMDPEIKKFENGKNLARFSLATSEFYKNSEGERVKDAQWHNVVAWGKTAEIAEKYLKKGSKIAVEGRLNNRQYETDKGEKKYFTEVVINELMMLDSKK
ncbi:MAG: single-stranded DNA-binding protein [Vicingaceae bacterium]